jgi:hypothetical protein
VIEEETLQESGAEIYHNLTRETMADTKTNDLDGKGKPSVPAWKLRESLREKGNPKKNNSMSSSDSLHSIGQKVNQQKEVDPNLPPAFRVVFEQRKAFKRQQERRKNNDEFVSLNSSHPDKPPSQLVGEDDSTSSLDDSFASMGEDILEGDEDDDQEE